VIASRWSKYDRAQNQIVALNKMIDSYAANQTPITIRQKFEADQQAWVCRIETVPDLPEEWGLLIGEILHNLRGALDHLVWDLAILENGVEPVTPSGRGITQFPICGDESSWKDPSIVRMTAPLGAHHRALIEDRQPYHGWDGKRPHPLLTLERLSNTDKHRTLRAVALAAEKLRASGDSKGQDCYWLGDTRIAAILGCPIQPNTELLRIPLRVTGPNPKMEVELGISVTIGLEDGTPIQDTLDDIAAFVRETLELFETDLTSASALATREKVEASHWPTPSWIVMGRLQPGEPPPSSGRPGSASP
jgi:hypothetical protein